MAIYHITVKTITRAKGQSAVRSAAYRHAAVMFDERLGKTEDYTAKKNVIHCEITIPPDSPQWLQDIIATEGEQQNQASEALWNLVELREKQEKSQVAREIEFALPKELTEGQSINLAREFITDQFALRGMIADWAVHWDEGNPHVHVMLTMREINSKGFGNKCRIWNHKNLLQEWRKSWAEYANFHLKLNHHDVRIDHRSYQDQGIELIPTIHQGKAVNDMERRGIKTSIMREANQIKFDNLQRIAKNPECLLKKVTSQHTSFTHHDVAESMRCYITDKAHYSQNNQKSNDIESGILSSEILNRIKNDEQDAEIKPVLSGDSIKQILTDIEYHESVFSIRELAKELSKHTDNAELFARALIEVKASSEMIYLGLGEDGRDRYTTQKMFNVENKLQILVEQVHQRKHIRISERQVNQSLEQYEKSTGFKLTPEQIHAVKHITNRSSLSCMIGRAGTGKSFTLGAARAVWQAQGLNVYGIALSGIAASGLKQSAGIESRTIESFRYSLKEKLFHLSKNDVLVMDEAAMTDTEAMLAIMEEVNKAKAKLVTVGDTQQLQPIRFGPIFKGILERIGFCEIKEIYRQKQEWQRIATSKLAEGKVSEGLKHYDVHGCIHFSKTAHDAKLQVVLDWKNLNQEQDIKLNKILVTTFKNSDVMELNQLIRKERLNAGDISDGKIIKALNGNLMVSINERLLMLKTNRKLGIENGNFATVINVNNEELIVKIDGKDNREMKINLKQYNHFDYGYAATVHKVQGATFDHTLVLSSGFGWDKHLTYVALSRHRETCNIYTDKESYANKQEFYKAHDRQKLKDNILDYPLAFAERRGLQIGENHSILISKHLNYRLKDLVKHIKDSIVETFNPESFWAKKEALAKESQEAEITLQRRDDARLVAKYVDSNRELGKAFEVYQNKLNQLGIKKLNYNSEIAEFVLQGKEYKDLFNAQVQRDENAFQIHNELNRYTKALEIYGISNDKLAKQSEQHLCRMRVNEYANALTSGKIVIRDRLAEKVTQNLSNHYSQFSYLKLDNKKLWNHANAHARRALLASLNSEMRLGFYEVEKYQECTRTVAKLMKKSLDEQKEKPQKQKSNVSNYQNLMTKEMYGIIQDRNQLANKILSNLDQYQLSLDFHRIGVNPMLNNNKNSKVISIANARWYRLQEHAAKAVKGQERRPKSIDEKQWLKIAKRYQKVNRQAGRAWTNIMKASSEGFKLSSLEKRKMVAEVLIAKRNYLAHLFIEQKEKLAWLSDFNEIEPVDIDARITQLKIKLSKAEQHAKQHLKQFQKTSEWRDLYENVLYELKQLTKVTMPYSKESHQDLIKALNKAQYKAMQYSQNRNHQYALMSISETENSMAIKAKNLSQLQEFVQQYLLQKRELGNINNNVFVLDKDKKERVLRAYNKAKSSLPIEGTLGEIYLREHRNIKGKLPSSLRFHPALYDYETRKNYPGLIAISKNISGKVQAVQATYLDSKTAKKAAVSNAKKTYGVLNIGNPIVIINRGLNKEHIVVAEGVETALSIKEANPALTIYATLGSSNFKHIPLTKETKSVLFCADNDGVNSSSQKVLRQASEVLSLKGIDAWQIIPKQIKQDFNDVLKNEGVEAIRDYLKHPQLLNKGICNEKLHHDIENGLKNTIAGIDNQQLKISEGLLSVDTKKALIDFIKKLGIYEDSLSQYTKNLQKGDTEHLGIMDAKQKLAQAAQGILLNKEIWQEIVLKSELSMLSIEQMGNIKSIVTKIKNNIVTKSELHAIKISIQGKGKSVQKKKSLKLKH